ncbi:unnamed protein product [Heligmosomoides polygyrus]|uniref:Host cell division inhibitor Icd-like protein n=1 Tax=Heligmosomoides polygyrus TaxID=6339 RepID=A0A183GCQ8_HELPZ|nr:unnamed protein product [Heligmosomoides polygyrus]
MPNSQRAACSIESVARFHVSSTVVTVGNRIRATASASFSFIRLAGPHRSICLSLGGAKCAGQQTVLRGGSLVFGNRIRATAAASFSFIRLAGPHRSICLSLGGAKCAGQQTVLRGGSLVWHILRICDQPSIAMLDKDKVNLCLGIPTIERHEMGVTLSKHCVRDGEIMRVRILKNSLTISVTCSKTETAMTAETIFRSPNVVVEITYDNDSVFWRHLCCLLSSRVQNSSFARSVQPVCGAYAEK